MRFMAGEVPICRVAVSGFRVSHRANNGELVRAFGELDHVLPVSHAGHVRLNRLELAANFGGAPGFGSHVSI